MEGTVKCSPDCVIILSGCQGTLKSGGKELQILFNHCRQVCDDNL